jgi:hypothetical protein
MEGDVIQANVYMRYSIMVFVRRFGSIRARSASWYYGMKQSRSKCVVPFVICPTMVTVLSLRLYSGNKGTSTNTSVKAQIWHAVGMTAHMNAHLLCTATVHCATVHYRAPFSSILMIYIHTYIRKHWLWLSCINYYYDLLNEWMLRSVGMHFMHSNILLLLRSACLCRIVLAVLHAVVERVLRDKPPASAV